MPLTMAWPKEGEKLKLSLKTLITTIPFHKDVLQFALDEKRILTFP